MSINLTQRFLFETDDINSLKSVLTTMIEVMVSPKQVLYLLKDEPFGLTPDFEDHDFEIPPVFPVGDKWAVGEHDRTFGGSQFLKAGEIFSSPDDAAKACCARTKNPLKSNMWISSISIRYSAPSPSENMTKIFKKDVVSAVISQVVMADLDKFEIECRPHLKSMRRMCDGSVHAGYRLKYAPDGGYDMLHICMIPILYGK